MYRCNLLIYNRYPVRDQFIRACMGTSCEDWLPSICKIELKFRSCLHRLLCVTKVSDKSLQLYHEENKCFTVIFSKRQCSLQDGNSNSNFLFHQESCAKRSFFIHILTGGGVCRNLLAESSVSGSTSLVELGTK